MLARRLAQPLRRAGARTSATDGRAAAQATLDSPGRQRLVVALGGNALLKRGEPLTFANQMAAAASAAPKLVELSKKHEVILVHGNGPQVGILALMEQDYSASTGTTPYTFDCLGAETQGQIGYVLTSAVLNVPDNKGACTIVTEVLVDKDDPAFAAPTKPVGALYTKEEADQKEVRPPLSPAPHRWRWPERGAARRRSWAGWWRRTATTTAAWSPPRGRSPSSRSSRSRPCSARATPSWCAAVGAGCRWCARRRVGWRGWRPSSTRTSAPPSSHSRSATLPHPNPQRRRSSLTMGGVGAAGCGWADHPDGWRRDLGELWEA